MGTTCGECFFAVPYLTLEDGKNVKKHECYRYPPTPVFNSGNYVGNLCSDVKPDRRGCGEFIQRREAEDVEEEDDVEEDD